MLRFESIFWASKTPGVLLEKLSALGFSLALSQRDPGVQAAFFGPEAIEIVSAKERLATLNTTGAGDGVIGIGLESENFEKDFQRLKKIFPETETPRSAKDARDELPLWYGFTLPQNATGSLRAWVMVNSPEVLKDRAKESLPRLHPNTCFGIEAVHMCSQDPESSAQKWGVVMEKAPSVIQWNENEKAEGRRVLSGERFLDFVKLAHGQEGIFMVTMKVTDLEKAKSICCSAGVKILKCASRDGFIVPSDFTGGPALRFVRSFWKQYLPPINDNFPKGRRTDDWRALGGAYVSTLKQGFTDDWNH